MRELTDDTDDSLLNLVKPKAKKIYKLDVDRVLTEIYPDLISIYLMHKLIWKNNKDNIFSLIYKM